MKKVLSVLLVMVMILSLAACGNNESKTDGEVYKVGMVCIGDENAAYDRNFYMAADAAKEQLAARASTLNGLIHTTIRKVTRLQQTTENLQKWDASQCSITPTEWNRQCLR